MCVCRRSCVAEGIKAEVSMRVLVAEKVVLRQVQLYKSTFAWFALLSRFFQYFAVAITTVVTMNSAISINNAIRHVLRYSLPITLTIETHFDIDIDMCI